MLAFVQLLHCLVIPSIDKSMGLAVNGAVLQQCILL